jgi:putative phage-type endonuclease
MEQRTDEWYAARLGKVTASRVADIIAKTKSGYSTSRANYMAELICERLTGVRGDFYMNAAMQWGVEKEPEARAFYEAQTGSLVTEVGFTPHNSIKAAGASPDGLVDDDGLVEFKCPITATHLDTVLTETVPGKYATQMQWQMACTGRKWCDFVSYDPRLPEEMRLFVKRVPRDDAVVSMLEREVMMFINEMDDKLVKLKEKYSGI